MDRGLEPDSRRACGHGDGYAPERPLPALLWLLWRRARLRWRGLRFVPRAADEIGTETLFRIGYLLVGDDRDCCGRHDRRLGTSACATC